MRQHLFFVWLRQAEQPVNFGVLLVGMIFFPWETCTRPMRFRRFLLRRYATTGGLVNAVARSLEVWRMGQCLFMIFWMGGGVCCRWW